MAFQKDLRQNHPEALISNKQLRQVGYIFNRYLNDPTLRPTVPEEIQMNRALKYEKCRKDYLIKNQDVDPNNLFNYKQDFLTDED